MHSRPGVSMSLLDATRGKARKHPLELAARRTGAERDIAEGARIALASPDTRPEIAVAVAITIDARRARVLLFSPLFLLYYGPSLFVLLFAV